MTQPQDALVPTTQSAVAVTVTVAKPIGMTPKSNVLLDGTRMVNTVAVPYTHLDVYKRQG